MTCTRWISSELHSGVRPMCPVRLLGWGVVLSLAVLHEALMSAWTPIRTDAAAPVPFRRHTLDGLRLNLAFRRYLMRQGGCAGGISVVNRKFSAASVENLSVIPGKKKQLLPMDR